ncbi:dipeptidase [Rikenella microfusus]|uniref:Succinyl-diaminopimelate desuccinylase n=1 Tax=Rikenella microfusus TaxID=28139 RepID=A0A379MT62_9BACT|nr:dipeptidase [Rikenella microfusus]SUE34723.1 Succinyl-diaminopimelate desuccinylase [Rikenella microfusus]
MNTLTAYLERNRERFLTELFEYLRIPSISSESAHKPDMARCAEWLREALLKAGADRAEIFPTGGNPIVYGEKVVAAGAPTVLVYGHYDVMPVDPIELWNTDPFEPTVKDGRIWGRGADDDKGQGFMHVKAFEALAATDTLRCNVKFMFEGEEEIGSGSLTTWCAEHKEMLAADIILVSDTSLLGMDTPSITCGLRGLAFVEIEATGPNRDLHSGLYGGAVVNPVNALCKMIGSLTDEEGRIALPGFYDDVREFSTAERAEINAAPFDEKAFASAIGIVEPRGEKGYTTMERKGIRPTLDVCGIWGGYTGEGAKTIIPSTAHAKVSMRLVANQDFKKVTEQFIAHIERIAPQYGVTVKCTPLHGGYPYVAPTDSAAYRAAARAMEETFGRRPVPFYSGGSIPIISTFERVLGIKSILMGFGLDTDAIHSPNENYPLENFYRGIETIPLFYRYFAENDRK